MSDPFAPVPRPLEWPASATAPETAVAPLPRTVGAFSLSSYYSADVNKLTRRQFTGRALLDLHDTRHGRAAVAIADIGLSSLAYVRSTGHDVSLAEMQRPNLLVPLAGRLSSRNDRTRFHSGGEPWLLIGRGPRRTTVLADEGADYEALVLSLPPLLLGDRLALLENRGGMIRGDPTSADDAHLAGLTRTLASQLVVTRQLGMDPQLVDAWVRILVEQIGACIDAQLGPALRDGPEQAQDLTHRHVLTAENLIFDHPGEIGSVHDIAAQVGVSERTLQAAFRKHRGATPTQVIAQAKLLRARQALLDRDGPGTVSAVCRSCGIEHHGRFSQAYRRAFGEHPVATLNARPR